MGKIIGIDLGTSCVVTMVLDGEGRPVAVRLDWADVVRKVALDLAPHGVRVNTVSPGDIDTPMLAFQAEQYGNGDPKGYYRSLLAKTGVILAGTALMPLLPFDRSLGGLAF